MSCDLVFGRGKGGFNDWAGSARSISIGALIKRAGKVAPSRYRNGSCTIFGRLVSTTMHDRLGIMPHVVETVLGHVGHQGGVAGRYNLALYRAEKAAALTRWADHVLSIVEGREPKVVPLRGGTG